MMPDNTVKTTSKICLLGWPFVGKSAILGRYVYDAFEDRYMTTLGVNIVSNHSKMKHKEREYELTNILWDISGSYLLHDIRSLLVNTYMEGSRGAMVVYDSTYDKTFYGMKKMVERFGKVNPERPVVFVANKVDAAANQELIERLLSNVASEHDAPYYFTSAKTGKNIGEAFDTLNKAMIES